MTPRCAAGAWLLGLAAAGCPDPCVFGGTGCNENADCAAGLVCRLSRDFDNGDNCFLVKGKCVDPGGIRGCGSVDDCDADTCCDPTSNVCVDELAYDSQDCDARTCAHCDTTRLGVRCTDDTKCVGDDRCINAGFAFVGDTEKQTTGVCRPACVADTDCVGDERCLSNACSAAMGAPCRANNDGHECFGLSCRADDAGDFCTGFCDTEQPCPTGFTCSGAFECSRG